MWCRALLAAIGIMIVGGTAAKPEGRYGLGKPATPDVIAPWDIDVRSDGTGLPPGHGTASQGATIFAERCSACHGDKGQGQGGLGDRLVGGAGTLATSTPVKTVGSFWPYATTLFDFVNRAMPFDNPGTLTPDEVYAVSAFILSQNGIVPRSAFLDAASLARVRMPNRDGFVSDPRPDTGSPQ